MICPKCGKNTSDGKDFCDNCGAALIGPQSIYLNEPNSSHTIDKNNISSITGIDINEISQSTSAFNDFNLDIGMADGTDKREVRIKVDFKLILLAILMLMIFGLSIYIMKHPEDCKTTNTTNENPTKCDNKIVTETKYIGHKVTTTNYTFNIPDGYEYNEHTNTGNVVIRGKGSELIVYPVTSGRIDNITGGVVESKYTDYSDVKVEETTLNQRKIYIVSYLSNGTYYIDFYYQFSGEKVLYGQGKSSKKETINGAEIRNIIASFGIRQVYGNFNYDPSGFAHDKVLSSLK